MCSSDLTARVLDAAGIQTLVADKAGCCGALRTHLTDTDGGLADMRRNIDAWWPLGSAGAVEALVMNASGCGAQVKDYGSHWRWMRPTPTRRPGLPS